MAKVSETTYLKRRIGDININPHRFKKSVLKEISTNRKITPKTKARLLATAVNVKPNSFTWKKSWDKGKLFTR